MADEQGDVAGWVVPCESHGGLRLAGVSHGHTALPLPTCLVNDNLVTTTDFKSDKLKTKQDTLSKTHSARHKVEKFVFSGWRTATELGGGRGVV